MTPDRALPNWAGRPIPGLTANAFGGDRQACKAFGMDDFIVKPVAVETLVATILRWLDKGGVGAGAQVDGTRPPGDA